MPFTHHLSPDHVHKANGCTNHMGCPADHWVGGRPEPAHPHHVEVDASTGLVGYTRLAAEEIAEHEKRSAAFVAEQEAARAKREADIATLHKRADTDPDFAALLRHLNI